MLPAYPTCQTAFIYLQAVGELLLGQSERSPDRLDSVNEFGSGIVRTVAGELDDLGNVADFWITPMEFPVRNALLSHTQYLCYLLLEKPLV